MCQCPNWTIVVDEWLDKLLSRRCEGFSKLLRAKPSKFGTVVASLIHCKVQSVAVRCRSAYLRCIYAYICIVCNLLCNFLCLFFSVQKYEVIYPMFGTLLYLLIVTHCFCVWESVWLRVCLFVCAFYFLFRPTFLYFVYDLILARCILYWLNDSWDEVACCVL